MPVPGVRDGGTGPAREASGQARASERRERAPEPRPAPARVSERATRGVKFPKGVALLPDKWQN